MKKSELIAQLQAIPGDPEVGIFDWQKQRDDDIGDGSSAGCYFDFEVGLVNDDISPEDWETLHDDEPMPNIWLGLGFKNEDYEDEEKEGKICPIS